MRVFRYVHIIAANVKEKPSRASRAHRFFATREEFRMHDSVNAHIALSFFSSLYCKCSADLTQSIMLISIL